jgi:aminopeptidase N
MPLLVGCCFTLKAVAGSRWEQPAEFEMECRWDEERFGLEYDLDLFNIVAVDDFNMGAMENKSLNVFNSRLVLASPDTSTDSDFLRIQVRSHVAP